MGNYQQLKINYLVVKQCYPLGPDNHISFSIQNVTWLDYGLFLYIVNSE